MQKSLLIFTICYSPCLETYSFADIMLIFIYNKFKFTYSSLFPLPKPMATTVFNVSIVLPLPESHIVEIMQYVDWHFQIGFFQYAFKFPPCFFMSNSSFLFSAK